MFRLQLCLWAAFLVGSVTAPLKAASSDEAGVFSIFTYSGRSISPISQYWSLAQDSHGVMYIANSAGVLEFDGASWRRIEVDNGRPALSVVVDSHDKVYVGSQNTFGFL